MKKVMGLILICMCFLCTGCFDYIELTDRALVSSISIDYKEGLYDVSFEIVKPKSEKDSSSESKVLIISGTGSSISEAFSNTAIKTEKEAYFAHLSVMIISEDIANSHINVISDYLLRAAIFHNNFYIVIAKDYDAKEIIEASSPSEPIVGKAISGIISNNKYFQSVTQKMELEDFISLVEDKGKNSYLPAISIEEDDRLFVAGLGMFSEGKLQVIADEDLTSVMTILNNKMGNHILQFPCEENEYAQSTIADASDNSDTKSEDKKSEEKDNQKPSEEESTPIDESDNKNQKTVKYTTVNLYKIEKADFEFNSQNEVIFKSKISASLIQNACNYDLTKEETYQKLEEKFQEVLIKEIETFVNLTKEYNSDVLGIRKKYLNKYRAYPEDWRQIVFKYKIEIKLNKNGLIYEVNK